MLSKPVVSILTRPLNSFIFNIYFLVKLTQIIGQIRSPIPCLLIIDQHVLENRELMVKSSLNVI